MFSIIYLCYVTCHTQWAWVTYGDSTKESTKEGLICSVREEPNSVQPCQFRFLTDHCQARAANPRKQPEKLGWESRNAFRDPRNSPVKSPEKSSGPRSFRVFGKDKTIRPHVNMSTSCRHVNINPSLWFQLVTVVPVGIWIRDKFKLKIYQSVKTPWQEYGVVAGS